MWTAGTNSHGHGSFWVDDKMRTSQRASWLLFNGPISDASGVVSVCGRGGLCVAPGHLELRTVGPAPRPVAERMAPFVAVGGPDECWPWTGKMASGGYGSIRDEDGRMTRTHRVAWRLANGPIPDGLMIRHSCDNPPCCNPRHLAPGTQLDNMRDMYRRQRANHPRGPRAANAKLTEADIIEIRSRHAARSSKLVEMAREYGLHRSQIERIVHRKAWAHLP